MSTTPNLQLPTWEEGNTQPDLVFNQLLYVVDALLKTGVETITSTPPVSPALGASYIVNPTGTGAWAGHDNAIAIAVTGGWYFVAPQPQWLIRVKDVAANYRYSGTAWAVDSSGGSFTNPMTTAGDIIVGGSGGTPTRLAKGADGTKLGVVAGALAYVADAAPNLGSAVTALSIASGVVNIDLSLGNYFTLALTANVTSITFSNLPASGQGRTIWIRIRQDGTGSRTVALPSSFKGIVGTDTAVQSAANAYTDLALASVDQGTRWSYTMKGEAA
jgi:hypothetical protein